MTEVFLNTIRAALRRGDRHGPGPSRPNEPVTAAIARAQANAIRVQAAAEFPASLERFTKMLTAVGGKVYQVTGAHEVRTLLLELTATRQVRRAAICAYPDLADLELEDSLAEAGIAVTHIGPSEWTPDTRQALRETLAQADLAISGADYAVAETGTLILTASPFNPRTATALPRTHVVIVRPERLLPTFQDLTLLLKADYLSDDNLFSTSCFTFVTGPSRTGDIEQTLTIGAHGPAEVFVIWMMAAAIREHGTTIQFGTTVEGAIAQFDSDNNEITIHESQKDATPEVLAAHMAHEGTHVQWDQPDSIDQEYHAFKAQAEVWSSVKGDQTDEQCDAVSAMIARGEAEAKLRIWRMYPDLPEYQGSLRLNGGAADG